MHFNLGFTVRTNANMTNHKANLTMKTKQTKVVDIW